ncbi:type II toxin-antitoxin system HipA family toxin YjjJ [Methylovulum psychrotolerans]|uniref:Phosphatidylinositol kinase n=1 Tax=Methylovulum psychrotolerans TaxID=1704499 RepID=A0A1Z4BXX9_9GAMM|nr:type II toxin-antitoxin system HipA family toxin YjjJ [Methylovulum psychrotolerans]ASF46138.1 phosphatidylinositol kinase [Methylovulum psychrotolerans]
MTLHAEHIRTQLASGPLSAAQLRGKLGVSQPTMSRAVAELGGDIVRFGAARSIHYTLRNNARGLPDIPIYRVNAEGAIRQLGVLIPVRPEGFVMRQEDGVALHSDGLPWWLYDMRPQGYLGRAYIARYGAELGLPERLKAWTDTPILRVLLVHGHDTIGNILLGEKARARFLTTPIPEPIALSRKAEAYALAALEAARGETPGSSVGGEQPKFTAYTETAEGARHVIVKFSELEASPVSERWRDLLLAEHLALEVLRDAGIAAAKTQIIDHGGQRFLEVVRFDHIGRLGRCALHSLTALDAEFAGLGIGSWPDIARVLANVRQINAKAVEGAAILWAFGTLIGNSDMHNGNLSFIAEHGRPYGIAPAYDMAPMAFAPRTGGGLPDTLPDAHLHGSVPNETWRYAEGLARVFLARVRQASGFSRRFEACIAALEGHIERASVKIKRLE